MKFLKSMARFLLFSGVVVTTMSSDSQTASQIDYNRQRQVGVSTGRTPLKGYEDLKKELIAKSAENEKLKEENRELLDSIDKRAAEQNISLSEALKKAEEQIYNQAVGIDGLLNMNDDLRNEKSELTCQLADTRERLSYQIREEFRTKVCSGLKVLQTIGKGGSRSPDEYINEQMANFNSEFQAASFQRIKDRIEVYETLKLGRNTGSEKEQLSDSMTILEAAVARTWEPNAIQKMTFAMPKSFLLYLIEDVLHPSWFPNASETAIQTLHNIVRETYFEFEQRQNGVHPSYASCGSVEAQIRQDILPGIKNALYQIREFRVMGGYIHYDLATSSAVEAGLEMLIQKYESLQSAFSPSVCRLEKQFPNGRTETAIGKTTVFNKLMFYREVDRIFGRLHAVLDCDQEYLNNLEKLSYALQGLKGVNGQCHPNAAQANDSNEIDESSGNEGPRAPLDHLDADSIDGNQGPPTEEVTEEPTDTEENRANDGENLETTPEFEVVPEPKEENASVGETNDPEAESQDENGEKPTEGEHPAEASQSKSIFDLLEGKE